MPRKRVDPHDAEYDFHLVFSESRRGADGAEFSRREPLEGVGGGGCEILDAGKGAVGEECAPQVCKPREPRTVRSVPVSPKRATSWNETLKMFVGCSRRRAMGGGSRVSTSCFPMHAMNSAISVRSAPVIRTTGLGRTRRVRWEGVNCNGRVICDRRTADSWTIVGRSGIRRGVQHHGLRPLYPNRLRTVRLASGSLQ